MIRNERGSMSAFLAMLFLVFLLVISVCMEGIYMYTAKGKAMGIYMSGISHTKGNYQKELADMYHIYAMDPRYRKKIETDFSDRMKESLEEVKDSFRFRVGSTIVSDDVDLTAQNGEVLKYQIKNEMKYMAGSDILKNLIDHQKNGTDSQDEIGTIKDQIKEEEEEAKQKEKERKEKEQNEQKEKKKEDKKDNEVAPPAVVKKEDPRKGFMKLLKEGSVSLVMGPKKVSNLPIDIVYSKKDTTKPKTWNFMNRNTMGKDMDTLKEASSMDSLTSELPGILYATKYFHCLTDSSKKEGTQYEIEYMIAGKDSEKENLGTVFWELIALRFLTNIIYVYKDPEKKEEAEALSLAVLGLTGFPPAAAVAKHLLLFALAYGESVIDVRNLAEGKKVPIVKSRSNWQLSFAGLATLTCKQKPVKQGMKYEDYLLALLVMQPDRRQKYFRMMDLIEENVKRKVPDFKLDQCISSYKITQKIKLKKLGFGGMTIPFSTYTDLKISRFANY